MRTLLFLASAATYAHAAWPPKENTPNHGDIGDLSGAVRVAGCTAQPTKAGCQAYSDLANAFVDLGDFTDTTKFTTNSALGQDGHYYVGDDLWLMHVDVFQLCETYNIDGATITQPSKLECDTLFTAAGSWYKDATTVGAYQGWPNANGCLIGGGTYYWNTPSTQSDRLATPTTSSATAWEMSGSFRQLCKIVSDAPPPPECIHPDVPVHVLRGVSVETVKVGRLNVGDVVIGEGKTSAVKRVEHFSVDDEACVVPKDLCGGFDDNVVVSKSHAVRCQTWPTNTWTFCQPDWQRVMTTEYVHVELESYLDDHLLSGSIVLESWDGYTRETDSIKDACSTRGCPWPHKWSSTDDNRWTRVDLRSTLLDASPRLRLDRPM